MIRAVTVSQGWCRSEQSGCVVSQPTGPWEILSAPKFDFLAHLHHNETPICSIALPLAAIRSLGLRFDDRLPVVEDWDFFVRSAMLLGVYDTEEPTSLYRRWESFGSSNQHRVQTWAAAHEMVLEKLDANPLLLPPGSARRLSDLAFGQSDVAVAATVGDLGQRLADAEAECQRITGAYHDAMRRADLIEASEWWRLTKPMRWLGAKVLGRS